MATTKIKFRYLRKEDVESLMKADIVEMRSRKDFDQKLRELRKEHYVVEYEAVK